MLVVRLTKRTLFSQKRIMKTKTMEIIRKVNRGKEEKKENKLKIKSK